jgi:predicted NBD/HSP70 family sugar kinase
LGGGRGRAGLARTTGLTPPAIAGIVQDLLDARLVRETGRRKASRGQPPIEIEIDKDGGYAVGLRVESGRYDFVVADLAGDVVEAGRGAMSETAEAKQLARIAALYERLAEKYGKERSLGLGLVTPGPFDSVWPGIPTPGAVSTLQTRSLVEKLTARLGVDVFLENDATAAALGERLNGVARDAADFFYVFVGEGIGGGLVMRGEPYRGASGNAGEFGHVVIDPKGPQCYCGNRGCLGQYLSLSSRRRRLAACRGAAQNAEDAWVTDAASALSLALVSVENLLDPEMVVLGGTASPTLLGRLADAMGELRPSVRQGRDGARLKLSELGEHCASLGAAALPIIAATSPF